ncbi:MAG: hypothetical protein U0Q03_14985 [Acidimicrobiales bacterium]
MSRRILGNGRRAVVVGMIAAVLVSGLASAGPPTGGALPNQMVRVLHVAGRGEVPADAIGVALNVTVTNPSTAGYVTVHPCLVTPPLASNVNFVADQTVPNFVIAGLDADGDACITTSSLTDLVVDVAGYVPAGSPMVPLDEPQRFLDTREGVGAPRTRVAAGQVLAVPVAGTRGVPSDAGTVVFNTTVVTPSGPGFVTVFPCGQPVPATSSVNVVGGDVVPNLTVAGVGAGGAVCFYSTVAADLVADVAAYVPGGAAGIAMLPSPQRLLDTRIGLGGPLAPVSDSVRSMQVGGVAGVPAGAAAVLVNLTATEGTGGGYAAAFPCGVGVPLVSNLNFARGQNVANAALVKLAPDGTMCLRANLPVHLVVDVTGYVTGPTALVPITPTRLIDSRDEVAPRCGLGIRSIFPLGGPLDTPTTFEVYDTRTLDRRVEFALPPTIDGNAFVMGDCSISLVGTPVGGGGPRIRSYSPTGAPVSDVAVLGTDVIGRVGQRTVASADELYSIRIPGGLFPTGRTHVEVYRIDTGLVQFELPDLVSTPGGPTREWTLMSVSLSGRVFALRTLSPTATANDDWMVALFAADGELLSTVDYPTGEQPIALSPQVSYLLSSGDGELRVRATDGTLITSTRARAPGGVDPAWPIGWMSEGAVLVCGGAMPPFGSSYRWELFHSVSTLTGDPSAGSVPCLASAA